MKMSCREIKRFPVGKRVAGKWVKQRVKSIQDNESERTSKEEIKKGGCVL
jgi:hypothetical protein